MVTKNWIPNHFVPVIPAGPVPIDLDDEFTHSDSKQLIDLNIQDLFADIDIISRQFDDSSRGDPVDMTEMDPSIIMPVSIVAEWYV